MIYLTVITIFQLKNDTGVTYTERTATDSINVGQDGYFDNSTVLQQFERLFQLLEFKEEYKHHTIECVVGNARTHSAKSHSLLDFGKSSGTRFPVNKIEYTDSTGQQLILDCYFQNGSNRGWSKGLLCIAKELKLEMPSKIKLADLRTLLYHHPAFQAVSFYTLSNVFKQLLSSTIYRFLDWNNQLRNMVLR